MKSIKGNIFCKNNIEQRSKEVRYKDTTLAAEVCGSGAALFPHSSKENQRTQPFAIICTRILYINPSIQARAVLPIERSSP